MAAQEVQEGSKKDWSLAESVLSARKTNESRELAPVRISVPVSPPLAVASPTLAEPDGILAKWRANQMGRKAALDALAAQYSGHLDLLKHNIIEQVKVGKERISVAAEEQLKELDAKHLEVLAQLGLRNADTRLKTMADVTDMVVARLKEIEEKDWPMPLKEEMITKAFALRDRVIAEIMKETVGSFDISSDE